MDRAWWTVYHHEVERTFQGERASLAQMPVRMQVTRLQRMKHYNNSGAAAISLAASRGAHTIIMLGYDCQRTNGMAHWHGDHPRTLGNAGKMDMWAGSFAELAADMRKQGVRVINASRATALTCFDRMDLTEALKETA